MKKILLIPLLFICFFASVKAQVINSQSQKYSKRVWVEGALFSDSVMVASDSTNRVPNSAWIKRLISTGATYTAGYGLGLTGFQFRVDSTIIATKSWANTVIPTATLARINTKLSKTNNLSDVANPNLALQNINGFIDTSGLTNTRLNSTLPRVSNIGNFKNFFSGSLASKKIGVFGNSTVAAANEFFTTLATFAASGKVLQGLPVTPVTYDVNSWVVRAGNIYNEGHNGATLTQMLTNGFLDTLINRKYDLIIIRGPLINDVRQGNVNVDSARKIVSKMLIRINTGCPNTPILFDIENSLLTTDPGGYGFIITLPTTETKVNGGTGGIPSAGSYTVQFASKPTSFLNNYPVYINYGLADQETVTLTSLTDTTFVGVFTRSHTQGFAIKATLPTTAQAYTNILRDALIPFANSYPNLSLLDMQQLLYGTTAPATSAYMLNSLHPGPAGRIAEANIVGDFLTAAQYRISQYAATNVQNTFVPTQYFANTEGARVVNDNGYISFYDSNNLARNGFLQIVAAGVNLAASNPTGSINIIGAPVNTNFIDNYVTDLSAYFTARTKIDKGYADGRYALINANTTGSAAKLTTARNISITGDMAWNVSFDGSVNATSGGTLATVNSSPGSYGSSTAINTVTVNAKGLVTSVTTNPVIAPAGTLTGTTLASNVITSSLTSAAGGLFGSRAYDNTSYLPSAGGNLSGLVNMIVPAGGFRSGFSVQAATATGAGSQPAYVWKDNTGADKFSQVYDVSSNGLYVFNSSGSIIQSVTQSGNFNYAGSVTSTGFTGNGQSKLSLLAVGAAATSPVTWQSGIIDALQIGSSGALQANANGANQIGLANNFYRNSSGVNTYVTSNSSSQLLLNGSAFYLYFAASGTAGTAVSLGSPVFSVNNTGNITAVLPTYSSGTANFARYSTPNDRFENFDLFGSANTWSGANNFTSNLSAVIFNSSAPQTTISGSVSGSAIASMPLQGSSYKKVVINVSGFNGTGAVYTFPVAFANTPLFSLQSTGGGGITTVTPTTTNVTFSGSATTGWLILEGY